MKLVSFINRLLPERIQGNGGFISALLGAGKAALPFLGEAAAGAGSNFLGNLFGGSKDIKFEDLRTPEQIAAAKALQDLAMTGSFDNINLGEAYGGSLGDYNASGTTLGALDSLKGLENSQNIQKAQKTYSDLADTTFDPSDPKNGFAAFQRQLARSQKNSSDILNREAAATGSRFGTAILGEKADLASRMSDASAQELARLYQNTLNSRIAGANGLINVDNQQQNVLNNLFSAGDFQRQLTNEKARAELQEFNRQRGETLSRIDLLGTEANRNPYLGVSSIPSPNPLSSLTNSVLSGLGKSATSSLTDSFSSLGGKLSGFLGGLFKKGSGSSSYMSSNYGGTSRFTNTGNPGQQPSWFK